MNKILKQKISAKKATDEQLLAFLDSLPEPDIESDSKDSQDAEEVAAETATKDNTLTMKEIKVMIASAVAEDRKTNAKDQPELGPPKLENDRAEPRYRVLKMS